MLQIPLFVATLLPIMCLDGNDENQPVVSVRIAGSNQLGGDAAFLLQRSEGTSAVAAVNRIYQNVKYLTEIKQPDPNRPIFQHYYFRRDKANVKAPIDLFSVVTMAPVSTVPSALEAVSPGIFKAPTMPGVFMRFTDGYAVLSEDTALLNRTVIPALPDDRNDHIASDVALTLHISVLPEEWKRSAKEILRSVCAGVVADFRAKDKRGTVQASAHCWRNVSTDC